jgi:sulfite exporter TauE/SafE
MFFHAHSFGSICGAVPGGPVLLLAMLLAGLAGSAAHCVPMCGAFVIGQVTDRLAAVPVLKLCELSRLRAGLLIPYHAGRLLTYACLGAVAAMAGSLALRFGPWPAVLLAAAGVICALQGWRRLAPAAAKPAGRAAPSRMGALIVRLGGRLDRTRVSGGFLLGVLLGFLPCGLLYAALVAAAATHSPAQGAAAMLAFGLGTVPALVAVGLAGQVFARARRRLAGRAGGAIMLANAALLWAMAARVL